MDNARDDVRAIEAAADTLVRGLNRADISSITDLMTETTLVMPSGRRTSKGNATIEFWRNFALANEGIQMLSTDMDTLAAGLVRDVGTLSLRRRQSGERSLFRYIVLWQKVDAGWTVATMTWNREAAPAGRRGQGGGGRQGGGGGQSDGGEGM